MNDVNACMPTLENVWTNIVSPCTQWSAVQCNATVCIQELWSTLTWFISVISKSYQAEMGLNIFILSNKFWLCVIKPHPSFPIPPILHHLQNEAYINIQQRYLWTWGCWIFVPDIDNETSDLRINWQLDPLLTPSAAALSYISGWGLKGATIIDIAIISKQWSADKKAITCLDNVSRR